MEFQIWRSCGYNLPEWNANMGLLFENLVINCLPMTESLTGASREVNSLMRSSASECCNLLLGRS